MKKILFAGSGITSAISAYLVKKKNLNLKLIVWDKVKSYNEVGGRMLTVYNPEKLECTIDIGAQYISRSTNVPVHCEIFEELLQEGILSPFNAKVIEGFKSNSLYENFIADKGLAAIPLHLFKKAGSSIFIDRNISEITYSGSYYTVVTDAGYADEFDIVILTMPIPEILKIKGVVSKVIGLDKNLESKFLSVKYSSRFASGFLFNSCDEICLSDGVLGMFVPDDPIIRFLALNSLKSRVNELPTVVMHTSVDFGKAYIEETPEKVQDILLQKIEEMFPLWPSPSHIVLHKWKYSQVISPFPNEHNFQVLKPGLVCSGDAFTHSSFEGCLSSAVDVANYICEFCQ